jgi:hypothetical protein
MDQLSDYVSLLNSYRSHKFSLFLLCHEKKGKKVDQMMDDEMKEEVVLMTSASPRSPRLIM